MTRTTSALIATYVFGLIFVSFLIPKLALAADPQKCTISESCKIGEFLYNDDYTPNSSATCTITSRDPSGSLYLNATSLTYSNGFYSTSTIPTTLGTYPTQICCTTGTEYMCLDKTFTVVAAISSGGSSLTAEQVWGYSDRSLTNFGDLIANIWNYSSRSLTSAITVDTTTLATKKDLEEINKINKENRYYLEKLVNKPIIQNFIDDKKSIDPLTKIKESQNVLNNLFATTQNLKNRSQLLSEQWNKLTPNQIATELAVLKKIVNDTDSKNSTTIVSHSNWLKNTWNDEIFLNLSSKVDETYTKLTILESDTNKFSTNNLQSSYLTYLKLIFDIDILTGNSLSDSNELSAFGFLQKTTQNLSELDKNSKLLGDLLTQIPTSINNIDLEIEKIKESVLTQNRLKKAEEFLVPPKIVKIKNNTPEINLKNKIYALLSLININKQIIAGNSTDSVKFMWLEEGSIVFRSVAYNPSKSIDQSVNVKFFLPSELKKEQVIAADPELKIDYDAVEGALYASADINLTPQESKTFTVETEDIWQFYQTEIDILKKQAVDITDSLKGTSLFTQASSTKSDIIAGLDKIMLHQKGALTPESRIKTFRESSVEMISIIEKIDSLKLLTAQASTSKFNIKFVGGVQVMAIWGIVILGIAGFIFMSYYHKTLRANNSATSEVVAPTLGERNNFQFARSRHHHKESTNLKAKKVTTLIVVGLIGSGIISVAGAFGVYTYNFNKTKKLTLENSANLTSQKQINLVIAETDKVPVKSGPSIVSPEVLSFKTDQTLYVYRKLNGWVKVGLTESETSTSWWISEQYIK